VDRFKLYVVAPDTVDHVRVTLALPGVAVTERGDIGALLIVFVLVVWPAQPIANIRLSNIADPDFKLELAIMGYPCRYTANHLCAVSKRLRWPPCGNNCSEVQSWAIYSLCQ
jgi:hypothetical protein